jgi:hypothetical protein
LLFGLLKSRIFQLTAEGIRVSILRMISYLPSCRSEYCVANVDCRRNYSIELVHISAGAKKSNAGVGGETARVLPCFPLLRADEVGRRVFDLHQRHAQAIGDMLQADAAMNHDSCTLRTASSGIPQGTTARAVPRTPFSTRAARGTSQAVGSHTRRWADPACRLRNKAPRESRWVAGRSHKTPECKTSALRRSHRWLADDRTGGHR